MSRLVTKNPKKSLEIGHILLKYLRGNPGEMHFPSTLPNQWGAWGQLKVQRHAKLLEVFADISYPGWSGYRSIQGLVVCYAGVPTMWMSGRQPFVTHSAPEAEVVTYCEGLLEGRSSEAVLCAIWGEELNSNSFARVMYGERMVSQPPRGAPGTFASDQASSEKLFKTTLTYPVGNGS